MATTKSDVHLTLPYAGALPFVGGAVCLIFGIETLPVLGSTLHFLLTYGLVIVSFMAGVHWGQYLSGVRGKVNLLVSSNAVALAAWFGFLLLSALWFCLLLVLQFTLLYVIDVRLHPGSDYLRTRRNVTMLVCLSLLAAAVI